MKVMLSRTTICGLTVPFHKSDEKNCKNCIYLSKKLFKNKYECSMVLGMNLDDGLYGYCRWYERKEKK